MARTPAARVPAPRACVVLYSPRDRARAMVRAAFPRRHGRIVTVRTARECGDVFRSVLVDAAVVDISAPGEETWRIADLAREFPSAPFFGLSPLRAGDGPAVGRCASLDFADVLVEGVDDPIARELIAPHAFSARFALPIALDTDVNAAALAEYRWGAGVGCTSLIYITIGTGIGGGVLFEGRSLRGRLHPELGHILLRRDSSDGFVGICPFHGDCIEGLLSGPALAARLGGPVETAEADDPRWEPVVRDLAQFIAMLLLGFAPDRVLIGGGVGIGAPHLVARALADVPAILGGYMPDFDLASVVTSPGLGADAGPLGAIALAGDALLLQATAR